MILGIYSVKTQFTEKIMTDKKQPLANDQSNAAEQKSASTIKDSTPKVSNQKNTNKSVKRSPPAPVAKKPTSKTAIIAIILAFISLCIAVAIHFWHNDKSTALAQQIINQNLENNNKYQQQLDQLEQLRRTQAESFSQQLTQMLEQVQRQNNNKIEELQNSIVRLTQNKPSDWLIHEAEYLIRVAARTMWLERDAQAAMSLLKDADGRLAELNSPRFLPIRQLIHQDIEQLKLMPQLKTEAIILELMGMEKQVSTLPLVAMQNTIIVQKDAELSSDIADWQSNLAKTWQKFLDTFVTVHSKAGTIEPLLSSQQQQLLKENLSFKMQQAQWAAFKQQPYLFQQTLLDIQQWLNAYFNLEHIENQRFLEGISTLSQAQVSYNYPSTLASLTALRTLIENQPMLTKETSPAQITSTETVAPETLTPQIPDVNVVIEHNGENSNTPSNNKVDKTPEDVINENKQNNNQEKNLNNEDLL